MNFRWGIVVKMQLINIRLHKLMLGYVPSYHALNHKWFPLTLLFETDMKAVFAVVMFDRIVCLLPPSVCCCIFVICHNTCGENIILVKYLWYIFWTWNYDFIKHEYFSIFLLCGGEKENGSHKNAVLYEVDKHESFMSSANPLVQKFWLVGR